MITKKLIFISIFLAFVITQVFSKQQFKQMDYGKVIFLRKNLVINVEIANTDTEKSQGLMFRENLSENKGMLFVYKQEKILSVWMKNTLIPLDIVFVSAQGVIVSITKDIQPCTNLPCQIYESKKVAKYILEINAGLVEKNEIRVGQQLNFDLM